MPAPRVCEAMLSRKRKGKGRVIDTTPEKVEAGVKKVKKGGARGLPTTSPTPTPDKASTKVSLELEDIEMSH